MWPEPITQYEGVYAKPVQPLSNLQPLVVTGEGAIAAPRANNNPTPISVICQMNGEFGAVLWPITHRTRRVFPKG